MSNDLVVQHAQSAPLMAVDSSVLDKHSMEIPRKHILLVVATVFIYLVIGFYEYECVNPSRRGILAMK